MNMLPQIIKNNMVDVDGQTHFSGERIPPNIPLLSWKYQLPIKGQFVQPRAMPIAPRNDLVNNGVNNTI